nr:MAG TPA: hypothetical protein [Crassvirales sp.]
MITFSTNIVLSVIIMFQIKITFNMVLNHIF